MDMTCWSQGEINWMVQLQFVGFFFGTPLFLILEKFGRIKALNLIIPILLLGTWLVMQTDSYNFMCMGFFLQGIAHIKKPLCYGFSIENCDQHKYSLGISIVLMFDMLVMFFFQFGAIFITNDAIAIVRWACLSQSFVILLLPFFMLESPTWLIQNRRNDEARMVLNKIAEFNGKDKSNYVPKHVKLVLKPLDEKQEGALQLEQTQKAADIKEIFSDLCKNNKLNETIQVSIFTLNCVLWYLNYFVVANMPGNIFVNGIALSFLDASSQLFGARIGMFLGAFRADKLI